jgi:16S rRNA (adenine1518-N6/adenine1519-N6)-dimethyltransferase
MVQILESRVANHELSTTGVDFRIMQRDVLKYDPTFTSYSVIANIPYYITSPILYHFLYEVSHLPETMVILLQRDVGDKIRKVRGNKPSVLSLFIDLACDHVEEICRVSPGSFVPAPKVESAVLSFSVKKDFDATTMKRVLEIIKIGFSERRKKLISNLEKGTGHKK